MNKIIFSFLFLTVMMFSTSIVSSIDLFQEVEALKSKGKDAPGRVGTASYGSANAKVVCGDRLCSEIPGGYDAWKESQGSSSKIETSKSSESVSKSDESMKETQEKISNEIDKEPLYNEMLNPRQMEYSNIVGFNDLHIEAIRHLDPQGDDSKLDTIVHHHCKVYDDMTAACLLFPTGMGDQDKPYGIEYIIPGELFDELSEEEKQYWHYHLTELPRAQAVFPDLTDIELSQIQSVLDETYGKVIYFWNIDDKIPMGEPEVLIIQNLPE